MLISSQTRPSDNIFSFTMEIYIKKYFKSEHFLNKKIPEYLLKGYLNIVRKKHKNKYDVSTFQKKIKEIF